ncbi:MAG: hypothetical protein M0C28_43945 [Candidatus Moduliflexus flocculans]|nr:hypothetical protein [Candidatus Moduliflexus flocculans]
MMATEANKSILAEAGLLTDEVRSRHPERPGHRRQRRDEALADAALQKAERLAEEESRTPAKRGEFQPKTIRGALDANPAANVAVISVAGQLRRRRSLGSAAPRTACAAVQR